MKKSISEAKERKSAKYPTCDGSVLTGGFAAMQWWSSPLRSFSGRSIRWGSFEASWTSRSSQEDHSSSGSAPCTTLSIEECCRSDFRLQYDLQPWEQYALAEPKPDAAVLDGYAKDISELCKFTGLRRDQVVPRTHALAANLATLGIDVIIDVMYKGDMPWPQFLTMIFNCPKVSFL